MLPTVFKESPVSCIANVLVFIINLTLFNFFYINVCLFRLKLLLLRILHACTIDGEDNNKNN